MGGGHYPQIPNAYDMNDNARIGRASYLGGPCLDHCARHLASYTKITVIGLALMWGISSSHDNLTVRWAHWPAKKYGYLNRIQDIGNDHH